MHTYIVCGKEEKRLVQARLNGHESYIHTYVFLTTSFMSGQPSMDTLGKQLATMPCVLVVDVIIQ